ncbi:MAG: Rrf2 family transcriptional regulator, partial [Veillonella atypica]|nr:Rrf2 family transcriptional regulator [Veillonella atypica]
IALVSCLEDDVEPCPMFNDCLTAPLWQYLQDEFRHVMERVSLQDVMDHKFPTE